MRQLTKKQKKLLDKWLEENSHLSGLAVCDVVADYMDIDFFEQLEAINDTEILYQEVNRYINDNAMKYSKNANPHFSDF